MPNHRAILYKIQKIKQLTSNISTKICQNFILYIDTNKSTDLFQLKKNMIQIT